MPNRDGKSYVLYVEDDQEYQEAVPALLRNIGTETCVADNVADALRLAAGHGEDSDEPFDLVVVDMHLPRTAGARAEHGAGIEVIMVERLRHYRVPGPHVPIVVYTAYGNYENCVAAVKAGADAYVRKVDEPQTLLETCRRLLARPAADQPSEETKGLDAWLDRNYEYLLDTYADKHVALVTGSVGRSCGLDLEVREEVMILCGDRERDVTGLVFSHPDVAVLRPLIFYVPRYDDEGAEDQEG